MEATKRSGIALLVFLVAVSCLANLSSARTHPGLDFLSRAIKRGRGSTFVTCSECMCPLYRTAGSSDDEDYQCYCTDTYFICPIFCKNCKGEFGEYMCLDMVSPNQCLTSVAPSQAKRMIKLPQGHE